MFAIEFEFDDERVFVFVFTENDDVVAEEVLCFCSVLYELGLLVCCAIFFASLRLSCEKKVAEGESQEMSGNEADKEGEEGETEVEEV